MKDFERTMAKSAEMMVREAAMAAMTAAPENYGEALWAFAGTVFHCFRELARACPALDLCERSAILGRGVDVVWEMKRDDNRANEVWSFFLACC